MSDVTGLVTRGALGGTVVALSVSDSADLGRLGLSSRHCDLAVAEVARAVLIAGGSIAYGGRLFPQGFTQILMDEVDRFGTDRDALTVYLAASEHETMSEQEIRQFEAEHPLSIRLVLLDEAGGVVAPGARVEGAPVDVSTALTSMRSHIAGVADAHVVVGGQLRDIKGSIPGVLEETLFALKAEHPIYVSGGFGGAAAAITRAMGSDDGSWYPVNYPLNAERWSAELDELARSAGAMPNDGLSNEERTQLAVSHRPADIASLVTLGLSRATLSRDDGIQ